MICLEVLVCNLDGLGSNRGFEILYYVYCIVLYIVYYVYCIIMLCYVNPYMDPVYW
jgi:hypothetical protein